MFDMQNFQKVKVKGCSVEYFKSNSQLTGMGRRAVS